MTIKLEEKMYKLGQSVGLTFDEREAMRVRLLSKIAHSERKILSPFSPMFYWQRVSMYVKPQYVSVALLAVLVVGGISAAAEQALPGEPLYQVKTSVNENVLGLFAFTPQSKAQLHTELAVRRLEEVEKLAISGKLDATTTAQAEVKIDGNLAVIKDSVKQLEADNNSIAAADTSSKAESSLKVHEAILGTLVDGKTAVNNAVADVATKVGIQATALSLDRAGMDSRNSSTTLSIDVLLVQQKAAQDAIASLQTALTAVSTSTATSTASSTASSTDEFVDEAKIAEIIASGLTIASTTATSTVKTATSTATSTLVVRVQIGLRSASKFLIEGNNKLEAKDYGEAFVLFKKAEKIALEAHLLLEVGDKPVTVQVSGDVSTFTSATSTASMEAAKKEDVL